MIEGKFGYGVAGMEPYLEYLPRSFTGRRVNVVFLPKHSMMGICVNCPLDVI